MTATGGITPPTPTPDPVEIPKTFNNLIPFLGIIASIPAIFFAYDGFYATAGIQTEMKEPKKISVAMVVGLIVVSVIDILISISLLIPNDSGGTITSLASWFKAHHLEPLYTTIQLMIAFGIFGILNGYAMYTGKFYEDLVIKNQIPFSDKFQNKTNIHRPFVGLIYAFILIFFYFVFNTCIGLFYLHNHYDPDVGKVGWGAHQGGIFQFNDLIGN
ncbi:hypothetical protein FACS1894166_07380 [Bacilli bacterium]|nr:hypothetical protein FACS1894166_07380 [Bacilli bacterium]